VTVVSNGREVRSAPPTGRLPPLVTGGGDVITIVYPSSQSSLDGPTRASLDQVTAQRLAHPGSVRAEIIADIAGAAAATDSQRLAYFRALEARNYLLARGLSPASIAVRLIARPTDDGRGRVLIRLSGG
jgi:hypothetical protein